MSVNCKSTEELTLSVCMIIKDEERVLGRCLSSAAKIADELIVVDTGSNDRSVEIAKEYTELVYFEPWQNSFARARNFAASKASGDYVMWLDADDVIYPDEIKKILQIKEQLARKDDTAPRWDVVFMTYRNYGFLSDLGVRDRIHRRELACLWEGDVHEAIKIDVSWVKLFCPEITIIHKKEHINEPGRNLRIFKGVKKDGRLKGAYALAFYCRELSLVNDMDQALKAWQELLDSEPNAGNIQYALTFISDMLIRLKEYDKCRKLISESFEKYNVPRMAFLCYRQGLAAERMGDREEAIRLYRLASETSPDISRGMIEFAGYNDYLAPLKMCALTYDEGDLKESEEWNNKAGRAWPEGMAWRLNRELFFTPKMPEGREPLVSVIMTGCEDDTYIEEAVDSIRNQTWKNTELITVGGSNSIADSAAQAMSLCKGEYIAFMGASDISLPDRLESQLLFLEHNKDIVALGTGHSLFEEGDRILGACLVPGSPEYYRARMLLLRPDFCCRTVMVRRSFLEENHIFLKDEHADPGCFRFLMETSKRGSVSCLAGVHYKLRIHGSEGYTDEDVFNGIRLESLLLSGVKLNKEDEALLARLLPDGNFPLWNKNERDDLTRILDEIRGQLVKEEFPYVEAFDEIVKSVLYH